MTKRFAVLLSTSFTILEPELEVELEEMYK